MQIKVRRDKDESVTVQVIDPSDQAVTHYAEIYSGDQITVTATSAASPADIDFGEVERIPSEEPEQADTGEGFEDGGETAEQAAGDLDKEPDCTDPEDQAA